MSFSSKTKNDLARIIPQHRCCQLAELAALVRMDGSIQTGSGQKKFLLLATENAAVARKFIKLSKQLFDLATDVAVRRKLRLKKNNVYIVKVPPQKGLEAMMQALEMSITEDGIQFQEQTIPLSRICCCRSYLRGAFLGAGSVNDPEGNYHLELISRDGQHINLLVRLMKRFQLTPKVSRRKQWYVLYLKESEQIINFLNIVGAHNALLEFENTRIIKEMRNNVNRLVNCETANLNKTIDAGMRQVESIRYLLKKIDYEALPEKLREAARLRLEFPEISLKELGQMMDPPVSKSAVNHRLRRLEMMAEELKAQERK